MYILFNSDNDGFDCDVSSWKIFLDKKFEYKQGYSEEYIVREIIDIFKTHNIDNLKVVIDDDLEELKIYDNDEIILEYYI